MQTEVGFVYVIRFGDYVKIGFSTDPHTRMKQLGSRFDGTLKPPDAVDPLPILAVPGSRHTEHVFHLAFHNDRAIGEYYHYRNAVKDWCDRLALESGNIVDFKLLREKPPPTKYVFVHCDGQHDHDRSETVPDSVVLEEEDMTSRRRPVPVDF